MEVNSAQVRYLLAIYDLARKQSVVSSTQVADYLNVQKASVSHMSAVLMEKGLVVKEPYSKLYLTGAGYLAAKRLSHRVDSLADILRGQWGLSGPDARRSARAAVCELSIGDELQPLLEAGIS